MAENGAHIFIRLPPSQPWTELSEIHACCRAVKMCRLHSLRLTQDSDHGGMFCVILMMCSPASFPPPKALCRRHNYVIKFPFLQHSPCTNTEMQALLFFPAGRHWITGVLTLFALKPQFDFWLSTSGETSTDHFCSLCLWGWFPGLRDHFFISS